MGAEASKRPPLLKSPWRTITWGDKDQADLQYVRNYKPQTDGQQLRILLHGLVGAGKSSFINSVQTVLHGRTYTQALANNSGDSFTKKHTTYRIQKDGPETFYPFVFSDGMGLSEVKGVLPEDIQLALKGHVKEGYVFNPESKLSDDDPSFVRTPNGNDKVHALVCVIDANTALLLSEGVVAKMKGIRQEASRLDIPQMVILTNIDLTCPEISSDLKNVYRVQGLKEAMETVSAAVGVPLNCIFPVKNYHQETDTNSDMDSLILNAMKYIIRYGDDFLNFSNSRA